MEKEIIREQCERNSDDSNVRQARPTDITEASKTPKDASVTRTGFDRVGEDDPKS